MSSKSLTNRLDKIRYRIAPGNPVLCFDLKKNGDIYLYENGKNRLIDNKEYARLRESCTVAIIDDIT